MWNIYDVAWTRFLCPGAESKQGLCSWTQKRVQATDTIAIVFFDLISLIEFALFLRVQLTLLRYFKVGGDSTSDWLSEGEYLD